MTHIVADLGNTATKIAVFENNNLVNIWRFAINQNPFEQSCFLKYTGSSCAISNVRLSNDPVLLKLHELFSCTELSTKITLPIAIKYGTPTSLGKDRLCNALGAWVNFPKANSLVVDFGTCIKYDIVTDKGEYLGGSISPGLNMRFKALHNNTANLPLLSPIKSPNLIGTTTNESILSGVVRGVEAEIRGIMSEYHKNFRDLNILFTGGDHSYFVEAFKNDIFALPNLTLEGLHSILHAK
jgi:type III pantothenate kinase